MSSQEIKEIIFEMSRANEDFPIYDLAKIIVEYVYEIPTKCVQTLSGHNGAIRSLIELKDGSIASGSWDCTIRIWKEDSVNKNGGMRCVQTLSGHDNAVSSLIELKDSRLASGSWDNTIKIWDKNASIFGKKQVGINEKSEDFSNNWICVQTLSGHDDAIISLIELKDGSLASGSYDRTIKIWSKNASNWLCAQTLSEHTDAISSIVELKDGSLASGSRDHTIKIWGKNAGIFEDRGKTCFSYIQTLSRHAHAITSLIELKDGSLASGLYDGTIKILGGKTYFPRITLFGHTNVVWSLIELKDGSLASGSWDHTIKIWDKNASIFGKQQVGSDNRLCAQTLSEHTDEVLSLIELKDGSLASGSYDHTIKIWN